MSKFRLAAKGFTVIELMIATSVFAVILLVITVGIVEFNKEYYKGVISSSTQNATRQVVDQVSQAVQYNGGYITPLTAGNPMVKAFCVGSTKRFSMVLHHQIVSSSDHALVAENVPNCAATAAQDISTSSLSTTTQAQELLGKGMRLVKFTINGASGSDLYTVTVRVAYGDDDLLCSPSLDDCNSPSTAAAISAESSRDDLTCRIGVGSQFCAVSELSTTVAKRIE